jgi:phytol kinase
MLVLGWSDGLATVVSRAAHVGEFQIWGRTESLAGISTMLLTSVAVLLAFSVFPAIVLWLAPLVTVVELLTPLGLDNLTVPVTVALALGAIQWI